MESNDIIMCASENRLQAFKNEISAISRTVFHRAMTLLDELPNSNKKEALALAFYRMLIKRCDDSVPIAEQLREKFRSNKKFQLEAELILKNDK